jgi:hypothetical protein
MDMNNMTHTLKTGDRIYCMKRKQFGTITRTNPFGMIKSKAVGVQWDISKKKDIIFGNHDCCMLMLAVNM